MSKALLYHYSSKPYKELLTPLEQHNRKIKIIPEADLTKSEKETIFRSEKTNRLKAISFMIDPLPINIIAKANFNPNHPVYKKGGIIYCHIIRVDSLSNMHWELAESPADNFLADYIWPLLAHKRIYFRIKGFLRTIQGYQGNDFKSLKKVINRFNGSYRKAFTRWVNNKHFTEQNHMYAASVPHLFLYPKNGVIRVEKTEKIIVE